MLMSNRPARWLAVACATLTSITAAAESRVDQADQLFERGRQLLASGRIDEACAAFDASQERAPATTTLFNQADCREKANQLATALRLFEEAERETRAATDDVGSRLHRVAVERTAALASRVSRLTIVVEEAHDLVVLRDDKVVPPTAWNAPQPIDGGTHRLSARRGDREVWRDNITVAVERANATVRVAPPIAPALSVARPLVSRSDARPRRAAWLATAGTAALLGGALAFELWGSSIYRDAVAADDESLRRSANTRRYLAQGFLGAGIATAGVSAWLWLRDRDDRRPRTPRVEPVVGAGFVGAQLGVSW
jgi:tetratricopeptide (TPR) repeat protein